MSNYRFVNNHIVVEGIGHERIGQLTHRKVDVVVVPHNRFVEDRRDARPEFGRDTKPDVKRNARPEFRPEARPDVRPATRPESRPETIPDVKRDTRPATKPAIVPEPKGKPADKGDDRNKKDR